MLVIVDDGGGGGSTGGGSPRIASSRRGAAHWPLACPAKITAATVSTTTLRIRYGRVDLRLRRNGTSGSPASISSDASIDPGY